MKHLNVVQKHNWTYHPHYPLPKREFKHNNCIFHAFVLLHNAHKTHVRSTQLAVSFNQLTKPSSKVFLIKRIANVCCIHVYKYNNKRILCDRIICAAAWSFRFVVVKVLPIVRATHFHMSIVCIAIEFTHEHHSSSSTAHTRLMYLLGAARVSRFSVGMCPFNGVLNAQISKKIACD